MRLRIAHQLSLLIATAVVLAVLAVGGLSVWNLRSGFGDYLQARDDEQLARLVQLVEQRAAGDPSMDWLRDRREAMRELMDTFNGRGAREEPPPPPGPPEFEGNRQPGNLGLRVLILDMQGRHLGGRALPPGGHRTVREVKVNGIPVATITVLGQATPDGIDTHFLQRQYRGLAGAALGTIALSLLLAWWVAARWARPLRELQRATRRIARGEQAVHLPVGNAPGALRSGALEIDQLITDVNAMSAALAALEATRRTWIAEISHELRTPLAVLRGELEAIEDGARQASPAVLRSLRDEVSQLTRLVDDLHTLAVADLGRMPCEFTPGDVNEALLRMTHRFDARAAQMGLVLDIIPAGQPIKADWDFGRIEQLLTNLLENSLRYTRAPGRIVVRWQASAHTVTLTVEDSAPGVPAAQLSKVFEPLFRADASRTRTGQHGSGLGLSIVRAIARAHRGNAQVYASSLGGLALQIELPLQPQQRER